MLAAPQKGRLQIFNLLVLFRWLSLLPPLAAMFLSTPQNGEQVYIVAAFFAAILINIIISLFASPLNNALKNQPWILGFDLLFVAGLMALTGGWASPYSTLLSLL